MKYYIEIGTINKAKQDIEKILEQSGYTNLTRSNFGNGGLGRFMTKLFSVARIFTSMHRGDTIVLQYPMKKFYKMACRAAHIRGAKVITVIHDLGAFRRHKLTINQENHRLSMSDVLIVHNETMKKHLEDNGYKGKISTLHIFDYLSDKFPATYPTPHKPWSVVYAGNLGRRRNLFLYNIGNLSKHWDLELYGKGFEEQPDADTGLHYHGFIKSDDFISTVQADFGLVWDGDSIDECTGAWGEYLKINDPHKTSFYLRAGIPVIVWSHAAMAPFVIKNNIGFVVDSLQDIDKKLGSITPDNYALMKHSAEEIGLLLADGHFVKTALSEAQDFLSNK